MGAAETRVVDIAGGHRQIGQQLGEACRDGVAAALDILMHEIPASRRDRAREQALGFLDPIARHAPHLVEELEGLAEGARVPLSDALLLQVRFELVGYEAPGAEGCTSFSYATAGSVVAGQNVDTTPEPRELGIVVRIRPDDGPAMAMYTYYPGMLGYLGINDAGLACFGNAVVCSGWKVGFPRYLTLRTVLESRSVDEATERVRGLERGSSINVILADASGSKRDLELTVDQVGAIESDDPYLVHANHYVVDEFTADDVLVGIAPDSVDRMETMRRRFAGTSGRELGVEDVKEFLRDHDGFPHSICRHRVEPPRNTADKQTTIASLVGEPREGRLHVCFGNPCLEDYLVVEV